jgi:Tol biopolymer transport system component/DNA-binding winged helix-turn-helix (wHTH) protein
LLHELNRDPGFRRCIIEKLVFPVNQSSGSGRQPPRIRFGVFELNLATHELTRGGRRVEIQDQPLRVIALLAQQAGTVVAREEMQQKLWAEDTFVDFESSLNTALRKARQALGDDAANPRFIETVPRQGYRFIAPVSYVVPPAATPPVEALAESSPLSMVALNMAMPEVVALPVPPAPRRAGWRGLTAIAMALAAAGGAAWWVRTRPRPPVLDQLRPFAMARGSQGHASFSPNGQMLAWDWQAPQDRHKAIYVQGLEATTPVRLSGDGAEASSPVWSPDGRQVAFLRDAGADGFAIYTAPLVGVGERKRADLRRGATPWLDWSPDGRWFAAGEPDGTGGSPAVVLIAVETGQRHAITRPPKGWRGDSEPEFSPDSSQVAFRRTEPGSGQEDIYIVPVRGGEPKRRTFDGRNISAFAFTPDGGLLFSSRRAGNIRGLWWMDRNGGHLTRVTAATADATAPAVSRDGKHFAFTKIVYDVNVWQVSADGHGAAAPLIDSQMPDTSAQFSPDGKRIVFQSGRSGAPEIWVCESDGGNAVKLTDGRGANLGSPRWSPDGRQIAFEWRPAGRGAIYVMPADGGSPRALVADEYQNQLPAWSHDGRFVYFASTRNGRTEIRKIAVQGGASVQVTRQTGSAPVESPDGKFLYYFRAPEVWRVALEDGAPVGEERRVLAGLQAVDWGNWAPSNRGIYYIQRRDGETGEDRIQYLDFDGSAAKTIYVLRKRPLSGGGGLSISPDGKVLLFAQVDQDETDIFVQ